MARSRCSVRRGEEIGLDSPGRFTTATDPAQPGIQHTPGMRANTASSQGNPNWADRAHASRVERSWGQGQQNQAWQCKAGGRSHGLHFRVRTFARIRGHLRPGPGDRAVVAQDQAPLGSARQRSGRTSGRQHRCTHRARSLPGQGQSEHGERERSECQGHLTPCVHCQAKTLRQEGRPGKKLQRCAAASCGRNCESDRAKH